MIRKLGYVLLSLPMLAGCASEPLRMELSTYTPAQAIIYSLRDSGQLTITYDNGYGHSSPPKEIYSARLDLPAMKRLKQAVTSSGVLLAESAEGGLGTGPGVRADIELGLWHNVIQTYGEPLPALQKVIEELNSNLPQKYRFLYGAPTVSQEAKSFQESWER